ncbi:VOC family protein [Caldithrix abyssi]|nr:VOC family protein [Caldithrix abyssi]
MADITSATFVLAVIDLDSSRKFFCEKLGFTEDFAVDGWSFLNRGACKLRIGHCPDAKPMRDCQDHSCFAYLHVTDAASLYEEVKNNKVEIWHELQNKPWGMKEFAIVTPDGHRILFGQKIA